MTCYAATAYQNKTQMKHKWNEDGEDWIKSEIGNTFPEV